MVSNDMALLIVFLTVISAFTIILIAYFIANHADKKINSRESSKDIIRVDNGERICEDGTDVAKGDARSENPDTSNEGVREDG